MNANLMFRDRDFSISAPTCLERDTMYTDFEIKRIIERMSGGDRTIEQSINSALFNPLTDISEILYRQSVLSDCMAHPDELRSLYAVVSDAEHIQDTMVKGMRTNPYLADTFSDALKIVKTQMEHLTVVRDAFLKTAAGFASEGFARLIDNFKTQLPDSFFSDVDASLKEFRERDGVLVTASLGASLEGINYTLCRKKSEPFWKQLKGSTYTAGDQDAAARADIRQRRERAINDCINPLAQAAEGIWRFFSVLRGELAFYVGCINLRDVLLSLGMPVCMPVPGPVDSLERSWNGLYDISLTLLKNEKVSTNRIDAHSKRLHIITGANQGGKSTFLRSFGQAQLMTQCGMFAPAESFVAPVRVSIFSHFRKEEDPGMTRGKFDEELSRLDRITGYLKPNSLILFNEAFAATNEREGSEICRQVISALVESGVDVFTVTHLYSYASGELENPDAIFLRAERLDNGDRTFHIVPGEPFVTAFGEDLYNRIFGSADT